MESLERSLNNITIDDGPWRQHDQSQPVWGNGGVQPGRVWGHVPVQYQNRTPWLDSNDIEQNVNEALGLTSGGTSSQWGPMGANQSDYEKQIWSDPLNDQHYVPPHNTEIFGGGPEWSTGSLQTGSQQIWSDGGMTKDTDQFWKQQPPQQQQQQPGGLGQGSQGQWGAPPMHSNWPPRQLGGGHPNGPRGGLGGPLMQPQQTPHQDFANTWGAPQPPQQQNGGGMNRYKQQQQQQQQPMNNMWSTEPPQQQRMMQSQRQGGGGGRSQQQQQPGGIGGNNGRYQGGIPGVDVSIPPPLDMQQPHNMGMGGGQSQTTQQQMRQMPPPGWKGPVVGQGAQNGGRHQYQQQHRGGGNGGNGGGNGSQSSSNNMWNAGGNNGGNNGAMGGSDPFGGSYNNFPINGPSDDLTLTVWHDPNGELKKWQRDTGVSSWGDPDQQEDRQIRYWLVPEGEEEDLETALSRCPVPQKKVSKPEDGARLPFPIPSKRVIVVTGWGELPENDPNNPGKSGLFDETNRWGDLPTTENPWYLPNQNAGSTSGGAGGTFSNETTGTWVHGGTIPLTEPAGGSASQLQLAEMLKYAVDKGYLDISVTMSQNLPPQILQNVNNLLAKIPALESVENELKTLVDSARPPGEAEDNQNPTRFMNDVQKVEHNRLIIAVTTAKIEVQEFSKKIQRALMEAGIVQPHQERNIPTTSENYHYSFLESP